MKELEQWSLDDLIRRVRDERLIDECIRRDDHVIIVQGSTRFVLDPGRAHAFLRGVLKGMSAAYRKSHGPTSDRSFEDEDSTGLFETFRKHLVRKWWGRYAEAGKPCGHGVRGLMLWIRYNTHTTAN